METTTDFTITLPIIEAQQNHIEAFAKLYMEATGLDATQIKLVQQNCESGKYQWWFEKK